MAMPDRNLRKALPVVGAILGKQREGVLRGIVSPGRSAASAHRALTAVCAAIAVEGGLRGAARASAFGGAALCVHQAITISTLPCTLAAARTEALFLTHHPKRTSCLPAVSVAIESYVVGLL